MCGKEILNDHTNFHIEYRYGYDSNYDCSNLDLDLCDKCLNDFTGYLIDNCNINPVLD